MPDTLFFPAEQPFSFHQVVYSHGWAQLLPFQLAENADHLDYVFELETGKVVGLRFSEAVGGIQAALDIPLQQEEHTQVATHIRWMFGLEQDFNAFYTLAAEEPKLAGAKAKAQGRLLRSATLFEDIVKTILTTNTTWGMTKKMVERLVQNYGALLSQNDTRRAFPSPILLASQPDDAFAATARLGYRAASVLSLARGIDSGTLDLEGLVDSNLPTPELRKRLLAIHGVGPYAAANLLMILGRYDYLPVDSWALKMVSHEWYDGQPIGIKEVQAAFERWGRWKGLVYWFWDWSYKGG